MSCVLLAACSTLALGMLMYAALSTLGPFARGGGLAGRPDRVVEIAQYQSLASVTHRRA